MQDIEYQIKRSKRAQLVRLAVHRDGSVIITAPLGIAEDAIEDIVQKKKKWLSDKISSFQKYQESKLAKLGREDYLKYKDEAQRLIKDRADHYSYAYGYCYNNISIKDQKTRWGSCSSKKNLNFNYKLLFLPAKIRDYIIVHEICHLKELNHSKKFWDLVAREIPDHKKIRKELKENIF